MENATTGERRKRRTRAEITAVLADYRSSKLTVAEFCASREIHPPTFGTWLGRYKQFKKAPSPAFAAIQVTSPPGSSLFAEVNGVKLYQPVSAAFIKLLMR